MNIDNRSCIRRHISFLNIEKNLRILCWLFKRNRFLKKWLWSCVFLKSKTFVSFSLEQRIWRMHWISEPWLHTKSMIWFGKDLTKQLPFTEQSRVMLDLYQLIFQGLNIVIMKNSISSWMVKEKAQKRFNFIIIDIYIACISKRTRKENLQYEMSSPFTFLTFWGSCKYKKYNKSFLENSWAVFYGVDNLVFPVLVVLFKKDILVYSDLLIYQTDEAVYLYSKKWNDERRLLHIFVSYFRLNSSNHCFKYQILLFIKFWKHFLKLRLFRNWVLIFYSIDVADV